MAAVAKHGTGLLFGGVENKPENELLLAATRPDSEDLEAQLARVEFDWAYVLLAAHRHALLPLLYKRLASHARALPAKVLEQMREHFEANCRRNARVLEQARMLSEALTAAGIEYRSPRVQFLLQEAYSHPGEREYEPLDLIVSPEHSFRARRLLAERGYRQVYELSAKREDIFMRSRPLPLQHDENGIRVHLQDRISPTFFPVNLSISSLGQGLGEERTDAVDAADALLMCCLTGTIQLWARLSLISDVTVLIAKGGIDWPRLCQRAREAHMERPLLLGLHLAHELMHAELPEDVAAAAAETPAVVELGATVRASLFRHLGRMGERQRSAFRLKSREHLLDQVRYCTAFALTPSVEDWKALSLPDMLLPAYHLLRPLRLAANILGELIPRPQRAPYFSTPTPVVERMLEMSQIGPMDVVYDLGCGDGRIVIEAARRYGARGVGIDLDPQRIAQSEVNARNARVEHLVRFVQGDVLKQDISEATVVTVWMLQTLNFQMRPKLQRELQPGTRVVGHSFDMGDWLPERTEIVQVGDEAIIAYLWTVSEQGQVKSEELRSERTPAVPAGPNRNGLPQAQSGP